MSLLSLCSPGEYQVRGPVSNVDPPGDLIYEANLLYRGCFRLPQYPYRYDYPARGLAYYPANDSLFVCGFANELIVGEVAVPSLASLNPTPPSVASLTIATQLQAPVDPTEFHWANMDGPSPWKFGGVLVHNGKLIVSAYSHYDTSPPFGSLSHFVCSLNLTYESGPWEVGATQQAGIHGGYMCDLPAAWQTSLGGYPCATGCIPENGVNRSSEGPTLHSFNPADLGVSVPAPNQTLIFYPDAHPYGGLGYNVTSNDGLVHLDYNQTYSTGGVVFPDGWNSVLCIGDIGTGVTAYGTGTDQIDLVGTLTPDGDVYVYDAANFNHGGHAYPYKTQIKAYKAVDLASVASGADPWSITPYATWLVTPPFDSYWPECAGAAWDAVGGRIFVSQRKADSDRPLIHVYTLVP